MGTAAKCEICGTTLTYSSERLSPLAEHFCYDHPDKEIGYFSINYPRNGNIKVVAPVTNEQNGPEFDKTNNANVDIVRSTCSKCSACAYEFSRDRNFKTTVETWTIGPNNLTCPSCGKTAPPLIRRQRNKIAKSSLGAMCLLGCWPLCFLPFMLGGSNLLNLYCKNCGMFLATYDRHLGQITREKFESIKVPNICK